MNIFDAMVFSAILLCAVHWQFSTFPLPPRCKTIITSFLTSTDVFL